MIMSTKDSYSGSRSSHGSHRFRDSTHLIPAASLDGKQAKRFDPWIMNLFVVVGIPISMLTLGIALEVGISISMKNGGFSVPPENVIQVVSSQFLLAFVPTIMVAPYAFMWRELDWMLRWYQPYIVLWKGNSLAEESLLLDYIALGPALALFRALKYKHRIIFWSALTAIATYIFQPLAGSIFQLRQRPKATFSKVNGTRTIGLAPNLEDLSAFVAAAGFAEASAFHGLVDPPFVQRGWATSEFLFPEDPHLNGTMVLNTTGLQTQPNCATPAQFNLTPNPNNTFTASATSAENCAHTVTFDPRVATLQYGVNSVTCPGSAAPEDVKFEPVMFWFFHNKDDGSPEARAIFCSPSIKAYNVKAAANLDTRTLSNVTETSDYVPVNNVTGGAMAGRAFNGLIFPPDPQQNPFIEARASAIRSGVSGAIFRFAAESNLGLQGTFDLPTHFMDITTQIYRQHLAITAKSIYFLKENNTLNAEITSLVPVLWIDPLPAHALALTLFLTGFIGVILQVLHRRDRRKLLLAAPPGSIAAVMSLTSRSGFGDLLLPYDDEMTLERKLNGLRFRLDRRTGAIVADDDGTEGDFMGPDDAMMSLLGQGHQRDLAPSTASSSTLAHQAATGYPPWVEPLKTPYDR